MVTLTAWVCHSDPRFKDHLLFKTGFAAPRDGLKLQFYCTNVCSYTLCKATILNILHPYLRSTTVVLDCKLIVTKTIGYVQWLGCIQCVSWNVFFTVYQVCGANCVCLVSNNWTFDTRWDLSVFVYHYSCDTCKAISVLLQYIPFLFL